MIYSHIFTHREVLKMLCNFKLSRHLNKFQPVAAEINPGPQYILCTNLIRPGMCYGIDIVYWGNEINPNLQILILSMELDSDGILHHY